MDKTTLQKNFDTEQKRNKVLADKIALVDSIYALESANFAQAKKDSDARLNDLQAQTAILHI